MADPNWNHGDYYAGRKPGLGLAVVQQLLVVAACCVLPAWFGYVLLRAERDAARA